MAKVSIGMPVYNGEAFLRDALQAIITQTYRDFELTISDNASTDRTECICREYMMEDSRIRYIKHKKNMGAAPNFNFLAEQASGEYFKWAAHDDVIDRTFLEKCVAALDADPTAALCFTNVILVDAEGLEIGRYENRRDFSSADRIVRFRNLKTMRRCYEVFGLIRIRVLRESDLIAGSLNGDAVFLTQLGLKGRFIQLPEHLILQRRHENQSYAMKHDKKAYSEWFDSRNQGRIVLPQWGMLREYINVISNEITLTIREKLVCYYCIGKHMVKSYRILLSEVLSIPDQMRRIRR